MLIYYCAKIIVDQDGVPIEGIEGAVGTIVKRGDTGTVPEIFEDQAGTAIIAGSQLTVTQRKFVRAFYIDEEFGPVSFWGAGVEMPLETTEGIAILLGQYRVETDARLDGVEAVAADAATSAAAAQAAAEDAAEQAAAGSTLPAGGNTGQVLAKNSGTDRDTVWIDQAAGGPGGTATWGSLAGKPQTFPPDAHTHPVADVTGTTALGRSLMAASTQQAAREAIGAGAPVAGFPGFGLTATTAAPGNHAHAQYVDSAQAATIADQRIAATGGGSGGGGNVLFWRYQSGAYPTLPTTKPAGIELVKAMGPVGPSSLPSWIGNAAGKAPLEYTYNGSLA